MNSIIRNFHSTVDADFFIQVNIILPVDVANHRIPTTDIKNNNYHNIVPAVALKQTWLGQNIYARFPGDPSHNKVEI